MLESLTVENYALIDHLEISFSGDLNIITGETGAGKSILLGALGLLLGGKNDGSATKDNTKSCVVEGQFSIGGLSLEGLFEQNDWEYEELLTIRRVITASGKSRSFVGDIPVSLSELKELGSRLICIHSQHQNQILSDEVFRVTSVDSLYDGSAELKSEYEAAFNELSELRQRLREREELAVKAKRDEEWLTHQVEELNAAKLRHGESEEAEAELLVLENTEQITDVLSKFSLRMDGDMDGEMDGNGVLVALKNSEREMQQIAKSYPSAAEYAERLTSVLAELKDMASSVADDVESIDSNPERLLQLTIRIDVIYSLCQKHRAKDLEELIQIKERYEEQLSMIVGSDEVIAKIRRDIESCERRARKIAQQISKLRREVSPKFSAGVEQILGRLGMEQAQFKVEIKTGNELMSSGLDEIDFLFSSVKGKSLQPISRIASGGEISRVMLAIKSLLSRRVELPTIIFDEIDTGVSGRIADAMGEIIYELSQTMQVVDITHLPQVASKGDSHFVVYKDEGRTKIRKLTQEQRVEQIATMISGSEITDAAMEQARILLW